MKTFLLIILAHVTHQFSLHDFAEVPQELLSLVNDIDADAIDLDSINEVFTNQLDRLTDDRNSTNTASENDIIEEEDNNASSLRGYKKKKEGIRLLNI